MVEPFDSRSHSWDSGRDDWQQILNTVDIPPHREQRHMTPVTVRARVVWERDGQETIEGQVEYWAGRAVLVYWRDPRLRVQGAWFDVGDVERVT